MGKRESDFSFGEGGRPRMGKRAASAPVLVYRVGEEQPGMEVSPLIPHVALIADNWMGDYVKRSAVRGILARMH